ncbi:hypothetical protein JW992_10190 [candidate division KSB1 bacterium]|nr:hypothetical protein [candidate division KSB1 bacterium]
MKRLTPMIWLFLLILIGWSTSARSEPDRARHEASLLFARQQVGRMDAALLHAEMGCWLQHFGDHPQAPAVAWKRALLSRENGDLDNLMIDCAVLLFLYPADVRADSAKELLQQIRSTDKDRTAAVDSFIIRFEKHGWSREKADRRFDLCAALYASMTSVTAARCELEMRDFLGRFPHDPRREWLWLWIAKAALFQRQVESALLHVDRVLGVENECDLKGRALLFKARLLSENRRDSEGALAVLDAWPADLADHPVAADLAIYRADLLALRLGRASDAIQIYQDTIDRFGVRVPDTYFGLARLYAQELEQPALAIGVYRRWIREAPDSLRSLEAQKTIALLYEKKIKDYSRAAQAWADFAKAESDSNCAAQALLHAADLCRKKLKNDFETVAYWRLFLTRFPDHPRYERVHRDLERLENQLKTL